ncbi:MAG: hypothetical protein Q9P01_22355 [Anaerolineae bacterium]|nr:hypothetical protein [Anaerolineae bacterium]
MQEDGAYFVVASAFFFSIDSSTFTLSVEVIDPLFVGMDTPATLEPDAEGSLHLYAVFMVVSVL